VANTIAATISAQGQAAIATVRISGEDCCSILESILSPSAKRSLHNPRLACYGHIYDLLNTSENTTKPSILDTAVVTFFPGPGSFTGEDVAEISIHGSAFLTSVLLDNVTALGARIAKPGEFSERAFLNGKLDLTQAEAIADLIKAETRSQAQAAQSQLQGRLSKLIIDLGEPLRDLLAEVEAQIDFPEEEIGRLDYTNWMEAINKSREATLSHLATFSSGRLIREGAQVVIAGIPNAGKSSLLNKILGQERAIVSSLAGTTRDSIEAHISLDGLMVNIWDTAGLVNDELEASPDYRTDAIERMGIAHSWNHIADADCIVFLLDPLSDVEVQLQILSAVQEKNAETLLVVNKCDLVSEDLKASIVRQVSALDLEAPLFLSAENAQGLSNALVCLKNKLLGNAIKPETVMITTARHAQALSLACDLLSEALGACSQGLAPEFVAFHIRESLSCLDEIIGYTATEDILGRIFSKFCIGK